MCRIAGFYDIKISDHCKCERLINKMTDSMRRGGPDDYGHFIDMDLNFAMGHRRLSIIDLSKLGHQPMANEDESVCISFNGEIYNYQELRNVLKKLGFSFKSNSDTEVILRAYERWGVESFERLSGMFAFSIYDKHRKKLYLVRDHAGIKPLYYFHDKDSFYYGSEMRSFNSVDNKFSINDEWKIYFYLFGYIPEPYSVLENVFMLPKGTYLEFDLVNNTFQIYEYTQRNIKPYEELNCKELKEHLKNRFSNSVKSHLISDAPIGVFLSGGIDSSLIAILASKYLGSDLRTLSIIFDEQDYSEEKYQDIVVADIKSNHNKYKLTESDFLHEIIDIFSAMDQPTIDGINSYFISKFAHEDGLKTVLSGIGGDEYFGGYPSFNRIKKVWFLRNLGHSARSLFKYFEFLPNEKLKKLSFLKFDNPLSYYLLFRGNLSIESVSRLLGITEKKICDTLEKVFITNFEYDNDQAFISRLETDLYMKNQLLRDTDFMSMWNSIEVRVPFLDKDLSDLVSGAKSEFVFKKNKAFLMETFKDLLPVKIFNRPKMGFTFPFQSWMKENINYFTEMISNQSNTDYKSIIKGFEAGNLHWSRFWSLVVADNYSLNV